MGAEGYGGAAAVQRADYVATSHEQLDDLGADETGAAEDENTHELKEQQPNGVRLSCSALKKDQVP
jgi:hypothetical protein